LTKILVLLSLFAATVTPFTAHSLPASRYKTKLQAARRQSLSTKEKTSMPPRNAKHRKRREQTVSEQQVAHHVAHQYLHGSGGALRRQAHLSNSTSRQRADNLKMLDRHPALLLNADYQPMSSLPLSLWHWQEAVKAVFSGKVTVVDTYPNVLIRAANLEVPLPSVIALTEYVPQFNQQRPAFTKRNVFLRDEYRCQYCANRFLTRDLSLDHVVPRCQGGLLTWENAVTCCNKCNCRKGSLSVDQLPNVGMKLTRKPYCPTQFQLAAIASRMLPQKVHPTWEPFLYYNTNRPHKSCVL
jgi:5-methylcytosine-specific restriction endonuclease McrA